jgi:glycosyltransferase involved in cell wall biosynthesis
MNSPLISIIVPVYKAESFLHQCIESILNQDIKDFELILINDGSPDNSGEICEEFAKADARVHVIHKKNEGVSKARNTGIGASTGKFIMFCDADDFVESDWCKEMVNHAKGNSFVISAYYLNDLKDGRNDKQAVFLGKDGDYFSFLKKDIFPFYQKHFIGSPWNKIYRSNIIKEHHIRFNEELSIGEDLIFNLDYLKHADDEILVVNKPVYNYVLRGNESLNVKYHENQFEIYKFLFNEVYKCLQSFGVDLESIKPQFYNSYLHALNHVLEHRFFKESKLPFSTKWKYNANILGSKEFTECLKYGNITDLNQVYVSLLKTQNYFLVYLYNYLSYLRNH